MKNVVLAYSFSDKNAGDFSLTIATLQILIENGYFVTVISRFGKDTEEYRSSKEYLDQKFKGKFKLIDSPFKLDREANIVKRQLNNLSGYLTSQNYIKDNRIINIIKESDIVILCPGNLLRCESFQDYMRLQALDYPLKLARKFNKKYIIFPQSSSIIKPFGKKLLGKMIDGSHTTFTREDLSFDKLKQLYPNANIVSSIDVAFLLSEIHRFKPNNKETSVAFTIRGDGIGGLEDLTTQDKTLLKSKLDDLVEKLLDKKVAITFIVQGTKADLRFTEKCALLINEKYNINVPIIEERDTDKLLDIYAGFDCLIGMRLHSIILAAAAGTPSYGLFLEEWGLKNPGIMDMIELPFSIVDSKSQSKVDFDEISNLLNAKESFQKRYIEFTKKESEKFSQILNEALKETSGDKI